MLHVKLFLEKFYSEVNYFLFLKFSFFIDGFCAFVHLHQKLEGLVVIYTDYYFFFLVLFDLFWGFSEFGANSIIR